jgi:purine nucleoside permease
MPRLFPPAALATITLSGLLAASAGAKNGSEQGTCRQADAYTREILPWLDSLATMPSAEFATLRRQLHLSRTSHAQVKLLTRGSACARAAQAVDSLLSAKRSARRVYLFQIGANFGVSAPNSPDMVVETGDRLMSFFDAQFRYLSTATH